MLHDRETVRHHQPRHRPWVIRLGAEGDQRTAVMSHRCELRMAEVPHERDHVAGHRPLGRLGVLGRTGG